MIDKMSIAPSKKVDKITKRRNKGPMSDALATLKAVVGSQARIAEALGLTQEHVSRMATGKLPVPEYVTAVVELLESLPRKDWPKRWK